MGPEDRLSFFKPSLNHYTKRQIIDFRRLENIIANTKKSREELEEEIARRKLAGKPVGDLNRELNTRKSTSEIKNEILLRKSMGKPVGQLNRELNRRKRTDEIIEKIISRKEQGKPTGQLEDELRSRGYNI